MLNSLKRFLLARRTVLTFILLVLGAVVLGFIFPQRFSTDRQVMAEWHRSHELLSPMVKLLGLDHVYTTPWFAVLLSVFFMTLALSCVDQIKLALKRSTGTGSFNGGVVIRVFATEDYVCPKIGRLGFVKIAGNQNGARFVKHPWGYWGNVLFHLGLVVIIASSLLVVLTEKRGRVNLVEGESFSPPATPWLFTSRSLLGGELILPASFGLEKVITVFWENDKLKEMAARIRIIDPAGRRRDDTIAINQPFDLDGIRIYLTHKFGAAFFVEFTGPTGKEIYSVLQIPAPSARDKAGYKDFRMATTPDHVKAKYYADRNKRSMTSTDPLLILRLVDGEKVIGETSLTMGKSGMLGPYSVKLVEVKQWAGIGFVEHFGMSGIFLGFLIIIAGSALYYFTPPRELYVTMKEGAVFLNWKAVRFKTFYDDEPARIMAALGGSEQV